MPLSIVEGHKEGAVADFEWLDTPKIDCQRTGESILSSKFHTLEEAKLGYVMKTRDFELGADNGMNLWQHVLSKISKPLDFASFICKRRSNKWSYFSS